MYIIIVILGNSYKIMDITCAACSKGIQYSVVLAVQIMTVHVSILGHKDF